MLPQTQLKFSRSQEGLKEVPKYLGRREENEDKMKVKSDLSVEIQFSSTEQLKKRKKTQQINWQGVLSQPNSFLPPLFGYPFSIWVEYSHRKWSV